MSLTEEEYAALAIPELKRLVDSLDLLDDERLECELAADILTLCFEDDTEYVINSHRAARQIWMAAERSAWHFDYVPAERAWIAAKTNDELWATVSGVVGRKLGKAVTLKRAA